MRAKPRVRNKPEIGTEVVTPQTWDREADVVMVGYGGAGIAASVTAHALGAEVLVLEKAPEAHAGGNTRIAAQGYLNTSCEERAQPI